MMELSHEKVGINRAVAVATIRLGLYDADPDGGQVTFVGEPYKNTRRNRKVLRDAIARYNRMAAARPEVDMCLGVFNAG